MQKKLKRGLVFIFVNFFKLIGPIFYNKKYLQGKWFDNRIDGWVWVAKAIWFQKILGFNRGIPWPIAPGVKVANYKNLIFHVDSLNNFQSFGIYFQCINERIYIGKSVYIAPNVGIITANHDINNLDKHVDGNAVVIGDECWIGMNAVILPGIVLGNKTIVGAGSVVTKSFPNGHGVVVGNPARLIKEL